VNLLLFLQLLNVQKEKHGRGFCASRLLFFLIFISLLVQLLSSTPLALGLDNKVVVVCKLDTVVNAAAVELIDEGLNEARNVGAAALVLLIDTPGGLLDATFDIVRLIERSTIPVVSFVYPKGATAWSAGAFIVLASHVAVMAPYSIIGSSQPRGYPFGELVEDPKLINSLTEFLVQRAKMHGRNETLAGKFVTENLNIDAEAAKDHGVVEAVASTIEEVLDVVDGMSVEVAEKEWISIQTRNAEISHYGPTIRVQALRIISNPNVAYILFILGVWGIIFGFLTTGFEGEIIGSVLLILGLIGLGFYVDLLVMILLILGGILIYVEMREPGLQFLGPAGVFCLLAGSLLLLRLDPSRWLISPQWYMFLVITVLSLTAILGGFSILVLYKVFKSATKKTAVLEFIEEVGRAIDEIGPDKDGFVRFHGELWKARSHTTINPGQKVRIVAKEGLTLIVEPLEES